MSHLRRLLGHLPLLSRSHLRTLPLLCKLAHGLLFLTRSPPRRLHSLLRREQEINLLFGQLADSCLGQGRIVFIAGEAGQGKTALINAFMRRAAAERRDLVTAGGACNAYTGSGDPYLPFREVLGLLSGDVEAHTGGQSR